MNSAAVDSATSPWVLKDPSVLVGLDPEIAFLYGQAPITTNEGSEARQAIGVPFLRNRKGQYKIPVEPDDLRASRLHRAKVQGNPLLELGKGDVLPQGYDVSSILRRPVPPSLVLGIKSLPEPSRVITAAATFTDAYFVEPGLIKNQPVLLDAMVHETDANGITSPANFWMKSGEALMGAESIDGYWSDPAGHFTYGRLISITGSDTLLDNLSSDKSSAPINVPSGPPAAFIPTSTLIAGIEQSQPGATAAGGLPLMVEEFLSRMLLQHPMLYNVQFTKAVFMVAVGIPEIGGEILEVVLDLNNVSVTPAEKAAFNKVYGGKTSKDETETAKQKPNKKNDSVRDIVKGPFILGLDREFNLARDEPRAAAAPAPSLSDEELANIARAKMYSAGLYVATIIYKKDYDLVQITPSLGEHFAKWVRDAAPEACGTYSPHAPRKISLSNIRGDFAAGRTPQIIDGLQNLVDRVDTFMALKLRPLFDKYNSDSGAFDYVADSIAAGAGDGAYWGVAGLNRNRSSTTAGSSIFDNFVSLPRPSSARIPTAAVPKTAAPRAPTPPSVFIEEPVAKKTNGRKTTAAKRTGVYVPPKPAQSTAIASALEARE